MNGKQTMNPENCAKIKKESTMVGSIITWSKGGKKLCIRLQSDKIHYDHNKLQKTKQREIVIRTQKEGEKTALCSIPYLNYLRT